MGKLMMGAIGFVGTLEVLYLCKNTKSIFTISRKGTLDILCIQVCIERLVHAYVVPQEEKTISVEPKSTAAV